MPNNNINPLEKAVNLGQLKMAYKELQEQGISDGHVSAPENHYSPAADGNAQLTATREGSAGDYALNSEYEVITGIKVQRDAKGHVTGVKYTSQKVKDTNTTYAAATTAANGLMSKEDKTTLDNIAAGYVTAEFVGEKLVITNGGQFVDETLVLG